MFLGLGYLSWRKDTKLIEPISEGEPDWLARMEALEGRFNILRDEVYESLERANTAYRRAAQARAYLKRRQESGDSEDEPEEGGQLPLLDEAGGDGQGVYPMHQSMEHLPRHQQANAAIAAQILGVPYGDNPS